MSVDITNFSFTGKWDSYYSLLTLTPNGETLFLWTLLKQSDMHQLLTGISLSIRIHTRESSLCCIIRVQQKPLPNRTVLFSKVLLYRISSSLWPLVKQGNKLGEGRQVKYRRPKLQMTGFFWRICTYTWFGLKAIIPLGEAGTKKFLCFRFLWPLRSAWPNKLVKLRLLRPDI